MPKYPTIVAKNSATRFFLQSEFSFANIPGLVIDINPLSAKVGVADGDPISQLQDSKTGYVFAQSTPSKQPLWRASDASFQNNPCVEFDGFDDFLQLTLNLGSDRGAIFVVCKLAGLATSVPVGSAKTSSANEYFSYQTPYSSTQKATISVGDGSNIHIVRNDTILSTTPCVLALHSNSTLWNMYLNGVDQTEVVEQSANSGRWFSAISATNVTFGILKRDVEVGPFYGKIARVLIYSGDITNSNILSIISELGRKYGILI